MTDQVNLSLVTETYGCAVRTKTGPVACPLSLSSMLKQLQGIHRAKAIVINTGVWQTQAEENP